MKPGRERRKAWIYSAINPILEALKIESGFLEKRNWTFRQHSGDLEFIRPLEGYVDYQSRPNWEDFVRSQADARLRVTRRDAHRGQLREACSAAFDYLIAVPEFQQEALHRLTSWQAAEGGNIGQRPERVVAEVIVNNIQELPDHYGYYRFWSRYRDELIRFRKGEAFDHADRAGFELKKSNDRLSAELIKVRSHLAVEYDIPWAPYSDESIPLPGR